MKKYIFKRVLYSIVAILVLLLLLFLMLELMPGSPFNDDKLSQEQIDILYQKYGLDDLSWFVISDTFLILLKVTSAFPIT